MAQRDKSQGFGFIFDGQSFNFNKDKVTATEVSTDIEEFVDVEQDIIKELKEIFQITMDLIRETDETYEDILTEHLKAMREFLEKYQD